MRNVILFWLGVAVIHSLIWKGFSEDTLSLPFIIVDIFVGAIVFYPLFLIYEKITKKKV